MSNAGSAAAALAIVDRGAYDGPSGPVSIADEVRAAVAGTRLVRPEEAQALVDTRHPTERRDTRIEVTSEGSVQAGLRLVREGGGAGGARIAVLNFASARRVGGGFLGGARAQEEDLCRASALYRCLETQRAYYDANRAAPDALYTDHHIWSPGVPFFRDDRQKMLDAPILLSVITSPAPNTGALPGVDPAVIRSAIARRAAQVLAIAEREAHDTVVLGAWGCGAFRGDPASAADAFGVALEGRFAGVFARVVFAVLVANTRDRGNLAAFQARFGA